MAYAIKAEICDPAAAVYRFAACKTMYGGKLIGQGARIFLFASETQGGQGLIGRGLVIAAERIAKRPDLRRQTPLVSVTIERTASAVRTLGRGELKRFRDWDDGRPESELNFKFYRQATKKIVGISPAAEAFLDSFFDEGRSWREAR